METTSTTIARTITMSTTTIIQMVREPTRKYASTTSAAKHADITTIATIYRIIILKDIRTLIRQQLAWLAITTTLAPNAMQYKKNI